MDTHYGINENGFYLYPQRPSKLPNESEYPREYTIKEFTEEEVKNYTYQRSIRGYSIRQMRKGDVNILTDSNKIESKQGWIPGESGLIFRSLQIGLIKNEGWTVVERNIGISLMPDIKINKKQTDQLSLFSTSPTETRKATGKNREEAILLASEHVKTFNKEKWIEISEQLDYPLAGIDYEHILTPEQERMESEYADKIAEVNKANEWILKEKNFMAHYKEMKIHKARSKRPKMVDKGNRIKLPEKINPREKAKFFCFQKEYGTSLKVEGIIIPIDIEGLNEIKELIAVKGSEFKGTPESSYSSSDYIVCEPYTGGLITYKREKSLKATLENLAERLMIITETENLQKIDNYIQEHHQKIKTLQEGGDVSKYIAEMP